MKRQDAKKIAELKFLINKIYIYKSKSELRLVYNISFSFNQKARVRYTTKPRPTVKNEL